MVLQYVPRENGNVISEDQMEKFDRTPPVIPSPAYEITEPRLLYGMSCLTADQLDVVELRIYGLLTYKQIEELTGRDAHTIRMVYLRAIQKMRWVTGRREAVALVKEMRASNHTWVAIALFLNINHETARRMWYER